ncbi:hypothetical protein ACIQYS_05235 [Psychrobacillus sp. NPDC096426]|uniref:hypothetical protein n=1 Tax=Psychrobacillus sp. NPDC096426 TaxID=3364491 RepID=UPI003821D98F
MEEEIKRKLDSSVPEHITLSEEQKSEILTEARHRVSSEEKRQKRMLKPILVGVAIIGLSGILSYPYVKDWREQAGISSSVKEESLRKVMIEGHDYNALINSIYDEKTDSMIYTDNKAIYTYSLTSNKKTILVAPKENVLITEVLLNEKWFVWDELYSENDNGHASIHILNRESNETFVMEETLQADLQLDGDYLVRLSFDEQGAVPSYRILDLETLKETLVHELIGEGTNSRASFNDGLLVIPERLTDNEQKTVKFFVYDVYKNVKIGEYIVPYEYSLNVTVTRDKIFTQLLNEDDPSILAYIDLESGELNKIGTPTFQDYAVFGDYVALSVPKKKSDTVELYKIEGTKVKKMSTFNRVKERLVKPRFTVNGMLIVNGEGEKFPMYLQDVRNME